MAIYRNCHSQSKMSELTIKISIDVVMGVSDQMIPMVQWRGYIGAWFCLFDWRIAVCGEQISIPL